MQATNLKGSKINFANLHLHSAHFAVNCFRKNNASGGMNDIKLFIC